MDRNRWGSAVVFGGYGTFGSLVTRELARLGISVRIAGRDVAKAQALARDLGSCHHGFAADVMSLASCRAALEGQAVGVNCAGPFSEFGEALIEACLEAGCHYADIADDRRYAGLVRSYSDRFRQRGLTAAYGCSSLPSISGALALVTSQGTASKPERARVSLLVGNDNPKGEAAIRSVLRVLGKPISAPQGVVRSLRERVVLPFPEPFGPHEALKFESPDDDLFPALLGIESVSVRVGFELRIVMFVLARLAMLQPNYGKGVARLLRRAGGFLCGFGSSGGVVMIELFSADGSSRRTALVARKDGQRMAALPCAWVVHGLLSGAIQARGALTGYEALGAASLLERLIAEGFELRTRAIEWPARSGL